VRMASREEWKRGTRGEFCLAGEDRSTVTAEQKKAERSGKGANYGQRLKSRGRKATRASVRKGSRSAGLPQGRKVLQHKQQKNVRPVQVCV